MKTFGNTHTNQSIYECADDWSSRQVTTSGLISYFKAYYGQYENKTSN